MARAYAQELNKLIARRIPEGDFVPATMANLLVQDLVHNDPDLYWGVLDEMSVELFTYLIRRRTHLRRTRLRRDARLLETTAALRRIKAGKSTINGEWSVFKTPYAIDAVNTQRPLGDMTGQDHLFVARHKDSTAKMAKMEAAFHRAVALKLGPQKKTSEVWTEDEILRLHRAITGGRDLKQQAS